MDSYYTRYIRHVILPDVGLKGQDVFKKSKVLCVGAGGLGASALIYLAATGIGSIGIVDFDIVDVSNLNRQIIFNESDIGKNKSECARRYISRLNSSIKIDVYDLKLSYLNCFDIVSKYDVVLDCTDNLESKFLINDIAIKLNIPLVHGSVFGFEGYVSVFSGESACYRCLYNSFGGLECVSHGILGPVAGIVGSIQALEVIKLLLTRCDETLFLSHLMSKLLILDFKMFDFRFLEIKKQHDCGICS